MPPDRVRASCARPPRQLLAAGYCPAATRVDHSQGGSVHRMAGGRRRGRTGPCARRLPARGPAPCRCRTGPTPPCRRAGRTAPGSRTTSCNDPWRALPLQPFLQAQVLVEPRRAHGARRQAGDAGELHDVLGARAGQHLLERQVGVSLLGDREGRAQLDGRSAQRLQPADVFRLPMPPAAISGIRPSSPAALQELPHFGQHHVEIEAPVAAGRPTCARAQVAAGQARDARSRWHRAAAPSSPTCARTSCTPRASERMGMSATSGCSRARSGRSSGKPAPTTSASTPLSSACRTYVSYSPTARMTFTAIRPAPPGIARARRNSRSSASQVGGVDPRLGRFAGQVVGALHQVRMQAPQVDGGDRADAAERGDGAGQAAGGDADAHAALHDGQQFMPAQPPGFQAALTGQFAQRVRASFSRFVHRVPQIPGKVRFQG